MLSPCHRQLSAWSVPVVWDFLMLVSWSSVNKIVLVNKGNGDFWSCCGLWVFPALFSSSLHPHSHFVHVFENCYFSVVCVLVLLFIRFR